MCSTARQHADTASSYERVIVLVLPYVQALHEIESQLQVLEQLGGTIVRIVPNCNNWPARPRHFDSAFWDVLFARICDEIGVDAARRQLPYAEELYSVALSILRGLASHHKFGKDNHSHEDDLWKSRGENLSGKQKHKLVTSLLAEGILGRKKNKSAGGTGWVYWIEDRQKAILQFPEIGDLVLVDRSSSLGHLRKQ